MKNIKILLTFLLFSGLLAGCASTVTDSPSPTVLLPATATTVSPTGTSLPDATTLPPPTATRPSTVIPTPEFPRIVWEITYGDSGADMGEDLLLAEDGGFYILGTTNFDLTGNGRSSSLYLLRTDPAGTVLWEKTYGSDQATTGLSITRTIDGNLLLAGTSQSLASGADVYLVKIDLEGKEIWSQTFGSALDEMVSASALANGSFLLWGNSVDPNDIIADPGAAGYAGYAGRSNIYLAKVDAEGHLIWSETFGGQNNLLASHGVPAVDGGFVVLATLMRYPDPGDDAYLLKVDSNGQKIWERTWEEGTISAYALLRGVDNQYLVAASTAPASDQNRSIADFLFIKVDDQGQEAWTSTFGDPKMMDYPMSVTQTADGGFIAAGDWVMDFSGRSPGAISITRIDANGQLLWEKTIKPGGQHNVLRTWLQLPDGSCLLVGSRFGQRSEIFLLKVDVGAPGNAYLGQVPPGLTPQVFAMGLVSVEKATDFAISFSPDGQELYFTRRLEGETNKLYEASQINGIWAAPASVTFATEYPAFEPHVSADNQTLYFGWITSPNKSEIWAVDRAADGWSAPRQVGEGMFVNSDKNGQFYVTNVTNRTLVKVNVVDGLFTDPQTIGPGIHPAIAPDGSYLVSDNGRWNLVVRFLQPDGSWGAPKSLASQGIPAAACLASISPDGKYLFYTYQGDIYWVSTEIIVNLK